MQAMKMDGFSSPRLPKASEAFTPGLGVEKVRTAYNHGSRSVFPPQAQGHRAQDKNPCPRMGFPSFWGALSITPSCFC